MSSAEMTAVNIENFADASSFLEPHEREQTEENNNNNNEQDSTSSSTSCCFRFKQKVKQYKIEIAIVIILFTLLAIASYFLKRVVYSSFDNQPECAACFEQNRPGFVFNQTGGQCFFFNFSQSQNYDEFNNQTDDEQIRRDEGGVIVFDAAYCGAPECHEEVIVRGVTPIPYWMILVSTMFSIVICVLINMIKSFILRPMKKALYSWLDWEIYPGNTDELFLILNEAIRRDPVNEKLKRLHALYQVLRTFGMMDPHYYLFLYISTIAHFIYILYYVSTSPLYEGFSDWKKYQTVYAIYLNSGTLPIVCFMYTQAPLSQFLNVTKVKEHLETIGSLGHRFEKCEAKFSMSLTSPITALSFIKTGSAAASASVSSPNTTPNGLRRFGKPKDTGAGSFIFSSPLTICTTFLSLLAPLVLPIIFTHVLPACLIFFPVWLLMLSPNYIALFLSHRFAEKRLSNLQTYLWVFVLRMTGTFVVLFTVQSMSSYAIMFYSGEYNWGSTITDEYDHRDTVCYANTFANNVVLYKVGLSGLVFS